MARRRLTPVYPQSVANVPHAEHSAVSSRQSSRAPIARVAADAAGTAAMQEMADALETARNTGRMVLDLGLEEIRPDYLSRDRLPVEDAEMVALRESIRAHGQRTLIEVTPLTGILPYGLISGWRRLMALKSLHSETGDPRFSSIQAIARHPDSLAEAYVNMVEENEIRVGLSQYERARVAALAVARGVFASEKAALLSLYATASRAKRSRIRAFLGIYHALDGHLQFPTHLPERLGLRLAEAIQNGRTAAIIDGLTRASAQNPEQELVLLERLLRTRTGTSPDKPAAVPLLPGVAVEQRLAGHTLTLKLTGPGVSANLAKQVRAVLASLDVRAKR